MRNVLVASLLVCSSPVFVHAQDTAPAATASSAAQPAKTDATVDPEAQKLLDKTRDAVKKLRDLSYTVSQSTDFGGQAQQSQGKVTIALAEKPRGFPFTMYRITINDAAGKPTAEWALNGKQIQKIDHGSKKLLTMETKGEELMPPEEIWPLLPQWLMEDLYGSQMESVQSASLRADAEVGGVKCKVVERVEKSPLPEMEEEMGDEGGEKKDAKPEAKKAERAMIVRSVKHVGEEDNLPRKFEATSKVVGAPEMEAMGSMTMKAEMKDMKANAGLTAEDFTLKAPEGYAAETGTYESMGLQDPAQSSPELKVKTGDAAPAFALKDPDGKETTMDSLKGRVVLLDFWATWCGPCKAAMPSLQKLHEQYSGKDVSIIGINTWEQQAEAAQKYMKNKKFTYGLLLKGDDLAKTYGVSGIPTMVLIDKSGKVLKTMVGFNENELDEVTKLIDEALAK